MVITVTSDKHSKTSGMCSLGYLNQEIFLLHVMTIY